MPPLVLQADTELVPSRTRPLLDTSPTAYQTYGPSCDFNHKVARTAMIWLNASTAMIWLKTYKRVASSISMS